MHRRQLKRFNPRAIESGRLHAVVAAMIQSLRGSWFREAFVVVREQTALDELLNGVKRLDCGGWFNEDERLDLNGPPAPAPPDIRTAPP